MPDDTHRAEALKFVLSHINAWEQLRRSFYEPIWDEMIENYFVIPFSQGRSRDTRDPYDQRSKRTFGEEFILKSPESRKAVDTYSAWMMNNAFPRGNEYIAAERVGPESALEADTMTRLIKHALTREGQRRAIQVAIQEAAYLGTSILKLSWRFEERPRNFRDLEDYDQETGLPIFGDQIEADAHIDDPQFDNIDPMDFYPFVGKHSLNRMPGAAHRFEMTGFEALKLAEDGVYEKKQLDKAIAGKTAGGGGGGQRKRDKANLKQGQVPDPTYETHPAFIELEGFEYNGEVPWKPKDADHRWRTITIIEGVVVRDIPWQGDIFRIPYFDITVRPMAGRLYGASIIESVRYIQSYLDFNLTQGAKVIRRMVDPPIIFNARDRFLDPSRLELWEGPIASDDPKSVSTIDYAPPINISFAQQQQLQQMFQDHTGVGEGMSSSVVPNRISQFQAQQTFQAIFNRPEADLRYVEEECLPAMGRGIAGLYISEFKQAEDPDFEIDKRIGDATDAASIEEINSDWDIRFIGSRKQKTEQEKFQGMMGLIQMAGVPQIQAGIPWKPILAQLLERAGFLVEFNDIMGFQTVKDNTSIALAFGKGAQPGNGNQQGVKSNAAATFAQSQGVPTAGG